MSARVLVACIGNVFLGDDGFGVEVARQLSRAALPPGAEVVDFGVRGLHLVYRLLDPVDLVVVVDAISRGGSPERSASSSRSSIARMSLLPRRRDTA